MRSLDLVESLRSLDLVESLRSLRSMELGKPAGGARYRTFAGASG